MIKQHRANFLYEDDFNVHRITVRRGHILDDTLVALCSNFDEKKHIRVRFLGEPAVDEGGPRREFFMLLMGAIANSSSLLDGPPNRRVLRHKCFSGYTHTHTHTHTHTPSPIPTHTPTPIPTNTHPYPYPHMPTLPTHTQIGFNICVCVCSG